MIAARPLRTSYSPCKRPPDGLADRSGRVPRREHQWHQEARQGGLDALLKGGRFETASYKRTFLRELQISSDCVLKPAMQHPRTQSRNLRPDCTGVGRVLGDI